LAFTYSFIEPRSYPCPEAAASTTASSLQNHRAETTSTSAAADTATMRLSDMTDLAAHLQVTAKTAGSSDPFNESRAIVRSSRDSQSTWQSDYVASIISDASASQSGSGNAYYSKLERVAFFLRHRRQRNDLETAKSLNWDMFPWPVLKRVASEQDILQNEVEVYLDSMYHLPENMFQTTEEHLMDNVRHWDINRMEAKVFGRVHENDLEKVKRGVIRVGGILRNIVDAISR
jgi:hypothetical protein